MSDVMRAEIKDLKEGKLVVIDGEPCKIVSIQKSKPGKHGAAKARVEGISLFTGQKKTLLKSTDSACEIPILLRKNAQVVADLGGDRVQLMDLETYETYELDVPEDLRGKLSPGDEVEVNEVMGRRFIARKR